jgi:hypothetical protein
VFDFRTLVTSTPGVASTSTPVLGSALYLAARSGVSVSIWMPRYACAGGRPSRTSADTMRVVALMGMAKPMPSPFSWMAVLIPITCESFRRLMCRSGPLALVCCSPDRVLCVSARLMECRRDGVEYQGS